MSSDTAAQSQPNIRRRPRPTPPACAPTSSESADVDPPVSTEADYAVGYGRPPAHTRFPPGRSGNPRGRPRGAKGLSTIVKKILTAKVSVRTPSGEKRISRMEALVHKTADLAAKGDMRALKELMNYYAAAVAEPIATARSEEPDNTATDDAILAAFLASQIGQAGGGE